MTQDLSPPLAGIRVIDFTSTLAAPHCTWLLSCLGADVIKVEPPHGDYSRAVQAGSLFANVNRNKRSVVADLRTDDGRAFARDLVAASDVVVVAFKPGAAARFGLGAQDAQALNPTVVYASVSGYGMEGPYADRPGYDAVAQAMSGMMAATGDEGGGPVRVGTAPIDYGTGVYTALSIVAALYRRERTGAGSPVEAALLETATSWMSMAYSHYSVAGVMPRRRGTANEGFVPYQVFAARDGEVFVGVATDAMFQDFCAAFDLPGLGADPRLSTIPGRCEHRAEVVAAVAARLAGMEADAILQRLLDLGIPASPVLAVDEVLVDPHVVATGAVQVLQDPRLGPMAVTPYPVRMAGVDRGPGRPAPTVGEHTDEVLAELRRRGHGA